MSRKGIIQDDLHCVLFRFLLFLSLFDIEGNSSEGEVFSTSLKNKQQGEEALQGLIFYSRTSTAGLSRFLLSLTLKAKKYHHWSSPGDELLADYLLINCDC